MARPHAQGPRGRSAICFDILQIASLLRTSLRGLATFPYETYRFVGSGAGGTLADLTNNLQIAGKGGN